MPRPTKYDEAKAEKLSTLLRGGCTKRDAAGSIGVSEDTLARWIRNNAVFAEQVRAAESLCAVKMTAKITAAAETDWKAALEWLKRRRRDEWGDNLNLSRMSDADLIALASGSVPGNDTPGSED